MPNTSEGAKKANETMRQRYGDDWFKNRARKAGQASKGGFKPGDPEAKKAGLKGAAKKWKNSNGGTTS